MFARLLVAAALAAFAAPLVALAADPAPLKVASALADFDPDATIADAVPGLVTARRSSRLGFETGGRVAAIAVDVGDTATKGDTLAVLDLRTLDAELAAAKANAAEAKAAVALARQTAKRQRELTGKGHVSQQRLDEANANVGVAAARVAAAEAAVEVIEARRALATLQAPFDGVITERMLDEGEIAAPGAPVVELVEVGALEIRVGLTAEQAADLKPGEDYAFIIEGRSVQAALRAATGVVDRQTQTITAVFDLAGDATVSPGAVARLSLRSGVGERGFWAPMTALVSGRRGLWSLYVLTPSDAGEGLFTVESRLVEVVYADVDRAFVRGSVEDGERYVTAGHERIVTGQTVSLSDDAPGAAIARHSAGKPAGKSFP